MDVNLEQYRIFCIAAEEKSFSKAAKRMYISQPAISQSISQLEQALKVQLFVRSGRGVTLTREGDLLYHYVSSALSMLEGGEQKLRQMMKLESGEVKIAVADTIAKHYLLPYLERFNRLHPGIRLQVINRTSDQSISLLKSSAVDLAFINLPYTDDELACTPCLEVQDIFVASSKYAHLAGHKLPLKELTRYPIIMLERLSNSRRFVDRFLESHGIALEPEIELGSHELLLEFAQIGLGISCVVREFSQEAIASGDLFELQLSPQLPKRAVAVCRLKKVPMSLAATQFYQLIDAADSESADISI